MQTIGEQAFFQIAAGLIPLLTFGGILAARPRELGLYERRSRSEIALAKWLLGFGFLAILGEFYAIIGAVTGHGGWISRPLVIGVILVSMTVAVLTASHRHRREVGLPVQKGSRFAGWVIVLAVGAAIVFIGSGFDQIVRVAQQTADLGPETSDRHVEDVRAELEELTEREQSRRARKTDIELKLIPLLAHSNSSPVERGEIRLLRSEEKSLNNWERADQKLLLILIREESRFYAG